MGLFDFFFRRKPGVAVAVGADDPDPSLSGISYSDSITGTFLNENVTYRGELAGLDYDRLIRDPQNWQNYVLSRKSTLLSRLPMIGFWLAVMNGRRRNIRTIITGLI